MHLNHATRKAVASFSLGVVGALTLVACGGGASTYGVAVSQTSSGFGDTALVSDKVGVVATTTTIDANLSNPWGVAIAPGLPFWIADNNSNLSTLYSGMGANETGSITGASEVGIAIPDSAAGVPANPTGQVYNGAGGFLISTSGGRESALFIFD